jgi:acetoin utilization deacetylase AcuC-like enzyme
MKVFYDSRQSVQNNESFSPSAQKPAAVVESWKKLDVPLEFLTFKPLNKEQIAVAHEIKYVEDILACRIPNGFGNTNPEVAAALPWVCGSMVASALYSLKSNEPSFSPTSGAHHAHYNQAEGFCTFNFLMIAAIMAKRAGAKKVGILDMDAHWGDGTDNIIAKLGIEYVKHYSFGMRDIEGMSDPDIWLEKLPEILFGFETCDLIIFNAGVDSHKDDPMGGVLTTAQLKERDHLVFSTMKAIQKPVCVSLAGGYLRDTNGSIQPVLELHNQTLIECDEVFGWQKRPASR